MAEVSPIFKKDDRMNKEKYRPISILPASSKPFECIIFDQLTNYFNDILSTFLAAYRKGYSTHHVLIKAIEDVKCSLDNGEHVGWVLMDLSKVFDTLPQTEILNASLKTQTACQAASSLSNLILLGILHSSLSI